MSNAIRATASRQCLKGIFPSDTDRRLPWNRMLEAQDSSCLKPLAIHNNLPRLYSLDLPLKIAEAFYLSAQDMEAVLDVMRITARNGWSPKVVKPAVILKAKCRPATYLYQRSGRSLCISQVNMLLALPMWPHSHRAHDLRHGIARHHHHNGMSRKAIASFLHHSSSNMPSAHREQKWSSPLDTYIRPVPSMLAELLNLLDQYYNGEDKG